MPRTITVTCEEQDFLAALVALEMSVLQNRANAQASKNRHGFTLAPVDLVISQSCTDAADCLQKQLDRLKAAHQLLTHKA